MVMRKPDNPGFSIQHEKTWIFDHKHIVLGSANATRNSLENCEEDAVSITEPTTVAEMTAHLAKIWDEGRPVTAEMVAIVRARRRANSKGLGRPPREPEPGSAPQEFDIGSQPPAEAGRAGRTRARATAELAREVAPRFHSAASVCGEGASAGTVVVS